MTSSPAPDVRSFGFVDDAVPRYESFFPVDEHRSRGQELAATHDHVTYREHGESRRGNTLWSVTVGDGTRTALLVGAPHPNEPVGSMTIDFLTHELAENDDLRSSLDYEFVCMPVADPDGVRLNEGWFDGPFTLSNYAQNFYRPPPSRQVEATFPVEHEDYSFDDPTPATRAIADLIETHHPSFVYSFHNTAFGGCYYLFSEQLSPLHDWLKSLPAEYDVPLDRGEPEYYADEAYDDSIYRLYTFEDMYEEATSDEGGDRTLLGGNAYDYARQFDEEVLEMIVEVPYFLEPRVTDQTELDRSREAVIREGVEHRRALAREVAETVDPVRDELPETPMAVESAGVFSFWVDRYDEKLDWAESADETDEPATVAGHVDEQYLRSYTLLPYLGMLLRSLDKATMRADPTTREQLVAVKQTLEGLLDEQLADLQDGLAHETVPIWTLVAIQARAGLACLSYRQQHG